MNLICIQSYPGLPSNERYQLYVEGKTYTTTEIFFHENMKYYRIKGEITTELFSQDLQIHYFKDIAKIRKEKLSKIQNLYKL